ncbi:uncharacterized protein LMH87_009079 [Akanthomyces muscarius]|uniref:Uncharacterized protein n=1 Tax=Akanthomyces muscarius TaxID=2231603 RepID=A0A9W8UQE3_AKAMU|nr:uncharacterized protein LMH87_009079 [Akanthomyces muscarius]KAJ4158557.1 hypothetical protein LMH87_009079 [Akanthomyces muscarius]
MQVSPCGNSPRIFTLRIETIKVSRISLQKLSCPEAGNSFKSTASIVAPTRPGQLRLSPENCRLLRLV